jgi:thiol-disulfide isomerase/thioredoxin
MVTMMRLVVAFACLAAACSNAAQSQQHNLSEWARKNVPPREPTERPQALSGKVAPSLEASVWFNTKPIDLQKLRGKAVLLDFWWNGCGPCLAAIPRLHELAKTYSDDLVVVTMHTPYTQERSKGLAGFDVVTGAPAEHALPAFLKARKFTLPVGVDVKGKTSTMRRYELNAWPLYVLVDRRGVVRYEGNSLPTDAAIQAVVTR